MYLSLDMGVNPIISFLSIYKQNTKKKTIVKKIGKNRTVEDLTHRDQKGTLVH